MSMDGHGNDYYDNYSDGGDDDDDGDGDDDGSGFDHILSLEDDTNVGKYSCQLSEMLCFGRFGKIQLVILEPRGTRKAHIN